MEEEEVLQSEEEEEEELYTILSARMSYTMSRGLRRLSQPGSA